MPIYNLTKSVDPVLEVNLNEGEAIGAERHAMVAMDETLSLTGKARGGFFSALSRKLLNDESFFQQSIVAEKGAGTVMLSPVLPGDIALLDVGECNYMISDGSFLAADSTVEFETKSQGLGRAILGNSGGLFVLHAKGSGTCAVSGFGSIREVTVTRDRPVIVDNGHLVAWDSSLQYGLAFDTGHKGFFGSLLTSQFSGEGIVLKFTGEGKIYVCSRNKGGFLEWIFGNQPQKKTTSANNK